MDPRLLSLAAAALLCIASAVAFRRAPQLGDDLDARIAALRWSLSTALAALVFAAISLRGAVAGLVAIGVVAVLYALLCLVYWVCGLLETPQLAWLPVAMLCLIALAALVGMVWAVVQLLTGHSSLPDAAKLETFCTAVLQTVLSFWCLMWSWT